MAMNDLIMVPRGAEERGRLELVGRPIRDVTLRVQPDMPELCRVRSTGSRRTADADGGVVRVRWPRGRAGRLGRLLGTAPSTEIELNPAVPWEIDIRGGIAGLRGDLRGLELRSLEIAGGAAELELVLAEPRGVVPLRVAGGISAGALRRPAGTAARLQIRGGASKLVLDDQRLGAIGGPSVLRSGPDDSPDRYDIDVHGGASDLVVAAA
jgi:hypothetical protein